MRMQMPPENQPNALREGSGDDVMNMIREGLDARDRAAADLAKPPETESKPETTPTELEPEVETTDGPQVTEEEPTTEPETSLNNLLEQERQENARLKKRLGDQGNQVGGLRERLAELGELLDQAVNQRPAVAEDPVAARYKLLTEKYGEDFAKDIIETSLALTADVRSKSLLGGLREEISDFKEYEPEMAELLKSDPELRAAVAERPGLLRIVHRAAKGSKLDRSVSNAEKRGAALASKIAAEKKSAFAERPGGSQNKEPVVITKQEFEKAKLDAILSSRADGRRR